MKFYKSEKGVALIITFFVMAIMLSIVLGISAILFIEIKTIRGLGYSVVAFYAADTGVEKTLYYDKKVILDGGSPRGLCDICNSCSDMDCKDCKIIGDIDDGCSNQNCNDCEISYYSEFDGKMYRVKATIVPSGEASQTTLDSFGSYRDTTRAIGLTYTTIPTIPIPSGIYSDPDGDIETLTMHSGEGYYYEYIDDGVRQPNGPNTDDYIYGNIDGNYDSFTMSDVDSGGRTAPAIKIWIYGNNANYEEYTGWEGDISLDGGSSWKGVQSFNIPNQTTGWYSITYSGSFSQTQINNLAVKLILDTGEIFVDCYAMYAEVTY